MQTRTVYDEGRNVEVRSIFYSPYHGGYLREKSPRRLIRSKRLVSLSLHGMVCSDNKFRRVLNPCAATLRTLCINGLVLLRKHLEPVSASNIPDRACLVKIFKFLNEKLNLEHVSICGDFTNTSMQRWTFRNDRLSIVESMAMNDLKGKLQKNIIYGGSCPLNQFEVPPDQYDYLRQYFTSLPAQERL